MMVINAKRIFASRWLDEIGEMNLVGIQIPQWRICVAVIVGDAPSETNELLVPATVIDDESQQPRLSLWRQKSNLTLRLLVDLSCK
jgi:hypothetical protein